MISTKAVELGHKHGTIWPEENGVPSREKDGKHMLTSNWTILCTCRKFFGPYTTQIRTDYFLLYRKFIAQLVSEFLLHLKVVRFFWRRRFTNDIYVFCIIKIVYFRLFSTRFHFRQHTCRSTFSQPFHQLIFLSLLKRFMTTTWDQTAADYEGRTRGWCVKSLALSGDTKRGKTRQVGNNGLPDYLNRSLAPSSRWRSEGMLFVSGS